MESSPSLFVNQSASQPLITIALKEPERTFFPGDLIHGTVRVDKVQGRSAHGQVEIHLGCSFQMRDKSRKQPQFKVLMAAHTPEADDGSVPFALRVPPNVPSCVDDPSVPAQILYKVKAIHRIPELAISLWPKASVQVRVHDQISIKDKSLQATLTSEKEVALVMPRDMYLKQSRVRKGDTHTVSAKLSLTCAGFLAGQPIPFALRVQHAAPVKHMVGAVVQLERVTHIVSQDNATLIESTSVAETTVPVICDPDHFIAAVTSKIIVPESVMPTCRVSPLQIFYRLRATVDMDMATLVEEGPVRKRDKAYSMMLKSMSTWQDPTSTGPTSTTISLELPITIGTVDIEPPAYTGNDLSEKFVTLALHDIKGGGIDKHDLVLESPDVMTPPAYGALPVPLDLFTGVSRQPSAPDLHDIEKPSKEGRSMTWSPFTQSSTPPPCPPRRHQSVYSE